MIDDVRSSARKGLLSKYRDVCVLGIAAIILAFPMLRYGPLPTGHDTSEHLTYFRHFSPQFWSGDLYPRWLVTMNYGLGSPTFFVYPPFPSYASALLAPLGSALHFNAFNVAEFLALFVSGISAFL